MNGAKNSSRSETIDKARKEGSLSREEFIKLCEELEKNQSHSNKKFFELFDLIVNQRFRKEEEYKKKVGFKPDA